MLPKPIRPAPLVTFSVYIACCASWRSVIVRLSASSEKVYVLLKVPMVCESPLITCLQSSGSAVTGGRESKIWNWRVTVPPSGALAGDSVMATTRGVAVERERRGREEVSE